MTRANLVGWWKVLAVVGGTALALAGTGEVAAEEEASDLRITGGGTAVCQDGDGNAVTVALGLTLRCAGEPNRLEVNWNGNRFHLESVDLIGCEEEEEGSSIFFVGQGRYNGQSGASIEADLEDAGEPGAGVDEVDIVITDTDANVVLTCRQAVNGGIEGVTLATGNIQAH